ncbi:MAG: DUF1259 domain-containing protein [Elusimicrobia bacterium]|nr:DUF1259 domain-containing protein [Elusimicrobiota bacterium]MDE2509904.1 DUF1259 domain-containing protein [Elusimicrobiota bacterium]
MNKTLALALLAVLTRPAVAALNGEELKKILGRAVVENHGEFKVMVPRTDLDVAVDGFKITPAMGLTAWIAFAPHGEDAMMMGDLVLTENEVPRAQSAAIAAGLSITAIHNHFLRDKPKLMFMHVGGMGKPAEMAAAARKVLDSFAPDAGAKVAAVDSSLDGKALDEIIGHAGATDGGVHKIVIGRPDVAAAHGGTALDSFMGLNTWMAFQGTPRKAAVAGDFAMLDGEVPGVIRALVSRGVQIAAVHNHMIGETPRITFLHFWGVGPAADLAKALRAALDQTGTDKKAP